MHPYDGRMMRASVRRQLHGPTIIGSLDDRSPLSYSRIHTLFVMQHRRVMHLAKDQQSSTGFPVDGGDSAGYEKLSVLVSNNAVVVFTISGCCMCHVVKQFLFSLGVGPTVVELDRHSSGSDIHALLLRHCGRGGHLQPVPAVFVGGRFMGGIEAVIAGHINGTLVPLLKRAGALWL